MWLFDFGQSNLFFDILFLVQKSSKGTNTTKQAMVGAGPSKGKSLQAEVSAEEGSCRRSWQLKRYRGPSTGEFPGVARQNFAICPLAETPTCPAHPQVYPKSVASRAQTRVTGD